VRVALPGAVICAASAPNAEARVIVSGDDRPGVDPIVDEFDAGGVPRQEEPLAPIVPEGETEHPVQAL
jgi:hypothetical protein